MAPRNVKANDQIKDERRNQILLAALKRFARNGFSATKMSDITNDAEISDGLVYHFFKSKDEIFTELIEYAIDSLGNVITEIKAIADEPIEQLLQIASRIFESIDNREAPGYYYVLMMNAISCEATPISASDIIQKSMNRLTLLRDIVVRGQKLGQIREGNPEGSCRNLFFDSSWPCLFKSLGDNFQNTRL
ncbi:TetR family transcriptional regulator [Acetobacterium paludosum]|uniref:TetR family transcriptional regulator n=1 Tax=Acetobacterium paludosum TaxID=52693 RepID=A0A923I0G1_9FIRM|nr:TetR/AcrR family transcriptional regulator [Acetobacterium paludosum]MBC3889406.1 TetR family transcriptional regulator [Acetobacterium paludosum]